MSFRAKRLGLRERPASPGKLPLYVGDGGDVGGPDAPRRPRRDSPLAKALVVVVVLGCAALWYAILRAAGAPKDGMGGGGARRGRRARYLDRGDRWQTLVYGRREFLAPEAYDREYDAVVQLKNRRDAAGASGGDALVDAFRHKYARGYPPPDAYRVDHHVRAFEDHHVLGPMWTF